MAELVKKTIRIVIDKQGAHTLTALEGFAGENCLAETKDLELVLGGTEVAGGKTDAYYDGDAPVSIDNLGSL